MKRRIDVKVTTSYNTTAMSPRPRRHEDNTQTLADYWPYLHLSTCVGQRVWMKSRLDRQLADMRKYHTLGQMLVFEILGQAVVTSLLD
jgi:hypothetical protein